MSGRSAGTGLASSASGTVRIRDRPAGTWTPCLFFYEPPHLDDRRLLPLHGRYGGEKATLQVDARRAHVVDRQSVLGIVDVWLAHPGAGRRRPAGRHPRLGHDQIGWDVRGHAVQASRPPSWLRTG